MIRQATADDRQALHALYETFVNEMPPTNHVGGSLEEELADLDEIVAEGLAFVAEEDSELAGFALGRRREGTRGVLRDLYVRPDSRRRGVASALTRAVVDALDQRGATLIQLTVEMENAVARALYDKWGFRQHVLLLHAPVEELKQRLGEQRDKAPSFGSVHVQTDDANAVSRAASEFVARLPGNSEGTIVSQPRNGWVAVYDELCDRDPPLLQRLARELSDRMGAVVLAIGLERGEVVHYNLYERGRSVDEYLSVPEYYGPLPPGDAVALGANPTVVARLTGADRARIRGVARTASSADDLPPAPELLSSLATEMRIEGATHGFAEAKDLEGAVRC